MSHIPQRKEKDCLNCGTIVQGRYCQNCGQENVVPKETFWHMVTHFFYDITHFDSNFFLTIKDLLFKPGFLSKEYMLGRRASYLHPIKMYVFTSAIFFLLFFSFFQAGKLKFDTDQPLDREERQEKIKKGEKELAANPKNDKWKEALLLLKDTSRVLTNGDMVKFWGDLSLIDLPGRRYSTLREYDSVQKAIPASERDGWFKRLLQRKNLKWRQKYGSDPDGAIHYLTDTFLHRLPYLLFVSLPLFALILKILYWRRKNFYYADHGVFSIHHYVFTFILLLLVFSLGKLEATTGWWFLNLITVLLFLSGGVYLYIAMKKFYGQGHGKTFIKFLLLNISGLLMLSVLLAIFVVFSFFEI